VTPELLIVGAGPAGVAAALWARGLDLSVRVLDGAPEPGGQLHAVHFHPGDVPGFEQGDGPVLAAAYARQLEASRTELRADCVATALEPPRDGHALPAVQLSTGERMEGAAILIATGVRRRHLEVPGERELEGRGVSYSATLDRARFAGRRIVVVGGGDAAFENALLLAAAGCDVTLLVRGAPRARGEFRARVADEPRIRVREGARVLAVLGEEGVRGVRFRQGDDEAELPAEGVVVKVGTLPNSEWCRGAVAQDAEGFVRVDERMATTATRVWAAGDVTRPHPPSIPVALGHGAQAVAAIRSALRGG